MRVYGRRGVAKPGVVVVCTLALALAVGAAPQAAVASCRGTKLLHVCTPNSPGNFYYSCYAVQVSCSLQKYSLEGVFSPFKYPIVSTQYYVPSTQVYEWQLTER